MIELCQTFLACDHCKRESTQTLRISTCAVTLKFTASAVSTYRQIFSCCFEPPMKRNPNSKIGSLARASDWICAKVTPSSTKALNVLKPDSGCPCGVITENDSSSA